MSELFKNNKAFRLLLAYQFFSSLGGGIFSLFMLLSVHLIYQNPIYTGIAGFLMALPFIFAFAVGPIVDRRNKVTIMWLTTLLEFGVLAMLVFIPFQEWFGVVFMFTVIFIYALAALFESPSSSALLPQIVPEDKIMEANSLIRIVTLVGGIVIAILLITTLDENTNVAFIYGISAGFLAFAFLFALLLKDPNASIVKKSTLYYGDFDTKQKQSTSHNYKDDLRAGGHFVRQSVLFYLTIAFVAKVFVIEVASISMPMFAEYHVGAQGYIILAVMGMLGGISASFLTGIFGKKFKVGQLLLIMFALAGIARIAFANILPAHLSGGLVILVFYAAMGNATSIIFQSLGQSIPPKEMVGRVDTIATTVSAIFVTIGALVGGFLGSIVPVVDHIFIYQGISYVVIGVLVFLVPSVRILPKMSEIEKHKNE
ncbi:MAG: MFS transporter [Defluviitaleaceae bacterium]|nr:MFS transporter [Defluviitaleaceae bacterium]